MQKILITGSNGLLGQKLVYKLKDKSNINCIATARGKNRLVNKAGYDYSELDITDYDNVESVFTKYMPDVIINTAAMTNVDICETDREGALLLNTTSVKNQVTVLEKLQKESGKSTGSIRSSFKIRLYKIYP